VHSEVFYLQKTYFATTFPDQFQFIRLYQTETQKINRNS